MIIYRCDARDAPLCEGEKKSEDGKAPEGWVESRWTVVEKSSGSYVKSLTYHWCWACEKKRIEDHSQDDDDGWEMVEGMMKGVGKVDQQ